MAGSPLRDAAGWVSGSAVVEPDLEPCVTVTAGPQADPIDVNIAAPDQSATVTVTNTLPAAAVGLQPRFTG